MPKPTIVSTGLLILSAGRYFKVVHSNPKFQHNSTAEFLIPSDYPTDLAGLEHRLAELKHTAAKWKAQADLLEAAIKFEKAKPPKQR